MFLPVALRHLKHCQNSKGELTRATVSGAYVDLLLSVRLAKLSTPSNPLIFYSGDSNEAMCNLVQNHFPEAIKFLRENPYSPEATESDAVHNQLWRLCIQSHRKVSLSYEPFPSGVEMQNVCAPLGRPISQRILIISKDHLLCSSALINPSSIASKRPIPAEQYLDWDVKLEPSPSDYELESDNEDDNDLFDSPKQKKGPLFCAALEDGH